MSRLIVTTPKPRNPLVAAARFRHAGIHGQGKRTDRRDARLALKRELASLDVRGKPPSF